MGLKFNNATFQVGPCTFSDSEIGLLSTYPISNKNNGTPPKLALIISGTDAIGTRNILELAFPTIPPMTRSPFSNMIPDFIVTNKYFKWKGTGGFLAAGFWGNNWEYRTDIAYHIC